MQGEDHGTLAGGLVLVETRFSLATSGLAVWLATWWLGHEIMDLGPRGVEGEGRWVREVVLISELPVPRQLWGVAGASWGRPDPSPLDLLSDPAFRGMGSQSGRTFEAQRS